MLFDNWLFINTLGKRTVDLSGNIDDTQFVTVLTDIGYFMTYMYTIYKQYVAKTELTDLKTRELDSNFKNIRKYNGEKALGANLDR